jgi:hypothetical protein
MDPKACLTDCDQAISDGDLDTADERLRDYWGWRRGGGSEPIEVAGTLARGDAFAMQCQQRMNDAQRQRNAEQQRGLYLDTGPAGVGRPRF